MISHDRELRKQQTKKIILDSAIKAFSKVGFDSASLGEIGKRCNIKKSLVQYHFETKDKLWKASIESLWAQLRQSFPCYVSPLDQHQDLDSIRYILGQIVRFAKDNPSWIGIIFREASNPGPRLDWLIENYLKKDFDDSMQFIRAAQHHDLLPDVSPIHLLHIVSGALTYALFAAPLTKKITDVDMTSDESLDTLVDALVLMLGTHTAHVTKLQNG